MSDHTYKIQAKLWGKKQAKLLLLVFIASLTLGACGKRASQVDAPPDVTDDHFPRTYPDPATDPKP